MRFIAAACAAMAISTVSLFAQAQPPEITMVGCIRAWKPAPADPTRLPDNDQPGVWGIYLLTPLQADPGNLNSGRTYVLTPSQIVNFKQHLDDKVEIVGVAQAAPAGAIQGIAGVAPRPENTPNAQAMPRLTVRSLKKISDSCPS